MSTLEAFVSEHRRAVAVAAILATCLVGAFFFLQQSPSALGQVSPGGAVVINITVTILNVGPEILWVDWPEEIPFNTNVTVNYRVRDNNTLFDLDPPGWVGFQYRFTSTDWVNCSVEGPFDVAYGNDYPWEGTYKGTFALPLVAEQNAHLRAIVVDDNGTMATEEMVVTTYQFLSMSLVEGGTQSFVLPPGEFANFTVKLSVKANFATSLLAFYPGLMTIELNGTRIGIHPLQVASVQAAEQIFTFLVDVQAPIPYPVNVTVESLYLIGQM